MKAITFDDDVQKCPDIENKIHVGTRFKGVEVVAR